MNVNRIAAWTSSVLVLTAVIAGFIVSGTPGDQRQYRFDERRVADLMTLSNAFDGYWYDHAALPVTLEELVDGRRLAEMPTDPGTSTYYEYRPGKENRYQLCAFFDRPSPPDLADNFWAHGSGRTCYSFMARDDGKPRIAVPPPVRVR